MSMFRRNYTTATWRAIADHLRTEGNGYARRGLRRESQHLYRLSREIEVNIRAGIESLMFDPADLARIDLGFARCCGVVEEPGDVVAAVVAQADQIIAACQRG